MQLSEKDIARFWSHVERRGVNECWIWKGSTNGKGYGQLRFGKRLISAHRLSYFIEHHEIDDTLEVCHLCDNPPCTNPAHLFQGTHTDNVRDMISKGRQNFQVNPDLRARGDRHGSHTHPERWAHGENHVLTKITSEQVEQVRNLRQQGVFQRAIAKMFGISKTQVARIEHRQSRKDG